MPKLVIRSQDRQSISQNPLSLSSTNFTNNFDDLPFELKTNDCGCGCKGKNIDSLVYAQIPFTFYNINTTNNVLLWNDTPHRLLQL